MSNSKIEQVILGSLVHNKDYYPVVLPHCKADFFEESHLKALFEIAEEYHKKYDLMPSREAIEIEIANKKGVSEEDFQEAEQFLDVLYNPKVITNLLSQSPQWLLDKTESYFKDRACYLAIMNSLEILDGKGKVGREAIPDILQKAVSIEFTSDIGHDYLSDWEKRYNFYNRKIDKIPFSLKMLNRISEGGYEKKTLNLFVAPTGVGKTLALCNEAGHLLMLDYNVAYFTLEMAEEKISERVDAKLIQTPLQGIKSMKFDIYRNNMARLQECSRGKLVVKQFPPRTITVKHLEAFLNELKAKKGWKPDVIIVDYMTLLNPYSLKGNNDNLYIAGKYVAEELRALAIRMNVAILSASQTNRNGQNNADFELNDLGESHAISQTADFMIGIITSPDLEALNQLKWKQLKNRYGSLTEPHSFHSGVDRSKMTLYDIDYKDHSQPLVDEDDQQESNAFSLGNNSIDTGDFVFN